MKLIDLHPEWHTQEEHGEAVMYLRFYCPLCKAHRIAIPIKPFEKGWDAIGTDFHDLTIHPSILHKAPAHNCTSHFFIRDGNIDLA